MLRYRDIPTHTTEVLDLTRLSHKKFTCLSNASNLLGQSAKSSSAARKFVILHRRNKRRAKLRKEPIIWA